MLQNTYRSSAQTFGTPFIEGAPSATPIFDVPSSAEDVYQSASLYWDRSRVLNELMDAYLDSKEEDWDSYGAVPALPEAYVRACKFIKALPDWAPDPEVDFSPEGRALLEWSQEPFNVLTLSISESGKVASSLLLEGAPAGRSIDLFVNTTPQAVLSRLRALILK